MGAIPGLITTGNTSTDMVACVAGEHCAAGTAVPSVCPPGQYSTDSVNPMATLDCTTCDLDKYCPEWGMT